MASGWKGGYYVIRNGIKWLAIYHQEEIGGGTNGQRKKEKKLLVGICKTLDSRKMDNVLGMQFCVRFIYFCHFKTMIFYTGDEQLLP